MDKTVVINITGVLENWIVQDIGDDYYLIWGAIVGDEKKRFADHTMIHTSAIKKGVHPIESLREGQVVETTYSRYKLGGRLKTKNE